MKTLTVEMVREWGPCYDPTDIDGVGEDWTGTVIDVLNSNISHNDKLWVVLRRELLSESLLREFARWCALQVMDICNPPQIVRDYLETGDDKKRAAASDAAWASDAARARAAAWASDAARAAQVEKLTQMIMKEEAARDAA